MKKSEIVSKLDAAIKLLDDNNLRPSDRLGPVASMLDDIREALRPKPTGTTFDVLVRNEGSIFMVNPMTPAAKEWISEHIPDDAQYFGRALIVEHRYIDDIIEGMRGDGLMVQSY